MLTFSMSLAQRRPIVMKTRIQLSELSNASNAVASSFGRRSRKAAEWSRIWGTASRQPSASTDVMACRSASFICMPVVSSDVAFGR